MMPPVSLLLSPYTPAQALISNPSPRIAKGEGPHFMPKAPAAVAGVRWWKRVRGNKRCPEWPWGGSGRAMTIRPHRECRRGARRGACCVPGLVPAVRHPSPRRTTAALMGGGRADPTIGSLPAEASAGESEYQRDQEQNQGHEKYDLRHPDRCPGDPAEAEHGRDQRDDQQRDNQAQHGLTSLMSLPPSIRGGAKRSSIPAAWPGGMTLGPARGNPRGTKSLERLIRSRLPSEPGAAHRRWVRQRFVEAAHGSRTAAVDHWNSHSDHLADLVARRLPLTFAVSANHRLPAADRSSAGAPAAQRFQHPGERRAPRASGCPGRVQPPGEFGQPLRNVLAQYRQIEQRELLADLGLNVPVETGASVCRCVHGRVARCRDSHNLGIGGRGRLLAD